MRRDLSIDFAPSFGWEWRPRGRLVEEECCASLSRFDQIPLAKTSFLTVSLVVGFCNVIKARKRDQEKGTHKVGDVILRGLKMNGREENDEGDGPNLADKEGGDAPVCDGKLFL